MRVTWLKQGKDNPPAWMQMWMYREIYDERLMTLMVVVIYSPNDEVTDVDQRTGDWTKMQRLFLKLVWRLASGP